MGDTQSEQLSKLHHVMFTLMSNEAKQLIQAYRRRVARKQSLLMRINAKRAATTTTSTSQALLTSFVLPTVSNQQSPRYTMPGWAVLESPNEYERTTQYYDSAIGRKLFSNGIRACKPDFKKYEEKYPFLLDDDLISGKLYGKLVLVDVGCHKSEIGLSSATSRESLIGAE